MTTTNDLVPPPATTTHPRTGSAELAGEEVRAMARFDRSRRRRVLDEQPQLDRMIALETVRRRRQAAATKSAVQTDVARARGLR